MVRTADVAQLFFRRLLEPFDAQPVEVRDHREHSSMDLLQTREKGDVAPAVRASLGELSFHLPMPLHEPTER